MRPPTSTEPRDAATVVIVRERPRGLELFCVERSARSGFMAGAIVFPGGKVDPSDEHPSWSLRATGVRERARRFVSPEARALAFAVAALRETLEEAAILPTVGDTLDGAGAVALRRTLSDPGASLLDLLAARQLQLDVGRLEALARWITPAAEPRRFDTRFYLLACPSGQSGEHDRHETTHSFWARPDEILERWSRGQIFLAPPTSCTVELFLEADSVEQAVQIARRQTLEAVCPEFKHDGDETILTLPGDPLHSTLPVSPLPIDAPTRFRVRDGRFVAERAAPVRSPRETPVPR